MVAPIVHVKPFSESFFEPPESITKPKFIKKWRQVFERMRGEAEQAGGFTVDMLLAERAATMYVLALMRDDVGVIPPQEATRQIPVVDDDGEIELDGNGAPVYITETFVIQEGWDHIRNQKEMMQVWSSMVTQLRQNMLPDVAAARQRAYDETHAMYIAALNKVKAEMPPDYAALWDQKFAEAFANIDTDALFALLKKDDAEAKQAVPGGKRRR